MGRQYSAWTAIAPAIGFAVAGDRRGAVAQLGERLNRVEEDKASAPFSSTRLDKIENFLFNFRPTALVRDLVLVVCTRILICEYRQNKTQLTHMNKGVAAPLQSRVLWSAFKKQTTQIIPMGIPRMTLFLRSP